MSEKIIVRMPPSPTGHLHLGTARAALFNWLFAKKNNGEIIFRWEDTDRERSKPEFETEILEGLKWLDMDFSKGKIFRQTECTDIHEKYLKQLWEEEKIIPCFVSPEELQTLREKSEKEHRGFVFWTPSREMAKEELQKKIDAGEKFVWRLKVPKNTWVTFSDLVRKKISVNSDTLGDFVVARSDGSTLYYLANVIDDWTQGITHVIRGEDHISNTPKQVLLYEALGAPLPKFGHIPLIFDHNKKKLSKRNVLPGVCVLIKDFQEAGFIPEGVVNGLVFLGWNPKSTEEIFSLEDLEKRFDLDHVNPSAAMYDFEKMIWFNAQWIRKVDIEKLQKYYQDFSGETIDINALEVAREKAKTLVELKDELSYLISDPGTNLELLGNEKWWLSTESAQKTLQTILEMCEAIKEQDWNRDVLKEKSIEKITALGIKNGEFLWPFRVALSNRSGSAGPFEIAEIIGKSETIKRLKRAS
jgi:glutamyl-tRNA synthetase